MHAGRNSSFSSYCSNPPCGLSTPLSRPCLWSLYCHVFYLLKRCLLGGLVYLPRWAGWWVSLLTAQSSMCNYCECHTETNKCTLAKKNPKSDCLVFSICLFVFILGFCFFLKKSFCFIWTPFHRQSFYLYIYFHSPFGGSKCERKDVKM